MKKLDGLKVLSIITMVGGAVLTFVTDIVNDKMTDKIIDEKIQKALSDKK